MCLIIEKKILYIYAMIKVANRNDTKYNVRNVNVGFPS